MGTSNAILLGVILGAMMCFDLGGPVNKAAYIWCWSTGLPQTYAPMAAIMATGAGSALGMGLTTFLMKDKFEASERRSR